MQRLAAVALALGIVAAGCAPVTTPSTAPATIPPQAQPTLPPLTVATPTQLPQATPEPTQAPLAPAQPTPSATAPAIATASGPVKGGQLVIATQADPATLDPTRSQDVYSNTVLSLTTDTLFEIDNKAQVVGRLVETTDNPEPNVYVFTLRKGIKFQDGTDLNADAVKFNLERHISDPHATTAQDVAGITNIETPDPLTVKITLDAPFAPFTSRLTGGAGFIQSPAAIQKLGDKLQRDLTGAGSGPYRFVSWEPNNQIVLQRNPDFWGKDSSGTQLPYTDRVILRPIADDNLRAASLKAGSVDALMGNPPYSELEAFQQSPDLSVNELTGLDFQFLFLDTLKEPFNKPVVRRALSFAIDRDQLRQAVLFGHGASIEVPVPKAVSWAYLAEYRPYAQRDLARAKQELASAGLTDVKFSLQIVDSLSKDQQLAKALQAQVQDAGFHMDIQPLDTATIMQNANNGDYQALMDLGWTGSVDPDGDLYPILHTGSMFNFARYSNPDIDKLLEDGRTNLDQIKRATAYKEAEKLLDQDEPLIVLYSEPQISAVRKAVQNYPQNYNGWWGARDLAKVWIRTED
jgi:peptide/nickel transport system substrate-binding protein